MKLSENMYKKPLNRRIMKKTSGTLSNNLVVLRAARRLSQKQVAEMLGVSRQTIVALEANKYNPSLKLAFEIATLFGKRIDEIFYYSKGDD